jgi:lipopolysaccharide export system protein LptA
MRHKCSKQSLLALCAATLCASSITALHAVPVEPIIQPTAYPVLTPSTMVTLPLTAQGDHIDVWTRGAEQRILLSGNATIQLAYRTLHADSAVVFLTPTNDGGEDAYDVAIYLAGNARVEEGARRSSTVSLANNLLVTSRVPRNVNLIGSPVSHIDEQSPIVQAGLALRQKLTDQPMAIVYVPNVTIQSTEVALQRGWIARADDNRIIAGPGEIAIANAPGGKIGPGGPNTPPAPPPPRPTVLATAEVVEPVRHVDGELVTLLRGSFYLLRSTPDNKAPLELRAQRAVLFSPEQGAATATSEPAGGVGRIAKSVTGVYLEGNVTVQMGEQTVRAERVYYDFTSDRAIMLDATLSSVEEKRNLPVYMRAREIRQLARNEYAAKDVSFSTSEFAEPHYQIGASSVYLQNVTPKDEDGKTVGPGVYAFKSQDTTIDVRGVPIFYWPFLSGRTDEGDIPLKRLKVGDSRTYGLSLQTGWDVFALANVEHPPSTHVRLDIDYFSKRGPATGLQAAQTTDDSNTDFRSYIMEDRGTDRLGRDRTGIEVEDETRGRVLGRRRVR